MLAAPTADYQYHDTYFVVAHFHYVIVGGVVFGLFAGLHYWWPKMFGKMLNDFLGKITFVLFFTGFHLTFFIQHFLGLWGMPRRVFTFLPGQGFETANLISTTGAFFMAAGTIVLVYNIIITTLKGTPAGNDPWEDGRTLEWAISSPAPEYNFKQLPLVKGLDPLWIEKRAGSKEITPAEPVGDIHMPNRSILPFIMAFGLFVSAFGFMYHAEFSWGLPVIFIGFAITFFSMLLRSVIDDHGYHIHKEELPDDDKGVKI
jgi:cytochrome c oxidase subunit 1